MYKEYNFWRQVGGICKEVGIYDKLDIIDKESVMIIELYIYIGNFFLSFRNFYIIYIYSQFFLRIIEYYIEKFYLIVQYIQNVS